MGTTSHDAMTLGGDEVNGETQESLYIYQKRIKRPRDFDHKLVRKKGKTGLSLTDDEVRRPDRVISPCPIFFSSLSVNVWNVLHPSGWQKNGIMSAQDLMFQKINSRTRPGWPFARFVHATTL